MIIKCYGKQHQVEDVTTIIVVAAFCWVYCVDDQ